MGAHGPILSPMLRDVFKTRVLYTATRAHRAMWDRVKQRLRFPCPETFSLETLHDMTHQLVEFSPNKRKRIEQFRFTSADIGVAFQPRRATAFPPFTGFLRESPTDD